jgi:hypothetical protein
MVFSPEENIRDLSGFEGQKHRAGKKVSEKFAKKKGHQPDPTDSRSVKQP